MSLNKRPSNLLLTWKSSEVLGSIGVTDLLGLPLCRTRGYLTSTLMVAKFLSYGKWKIVVSISFVAYGINMQRNHLNDREILRLNFPSKSRKRLQFPATNISYHFTYYFRNRSKLSEIISKLFRIVIQLTFSDLVRTGSEDGPLLSGASVRTHCKVHWFATN